MKFLIDAVQIRPFSLDHPQLRPKNQGVTSFGGASGDGSTEDFGFTSPAVPALNVVSPSVAAVALTTHNFA